MNSMVNSTFTSTMFTLLNMSFYMGYLFAEVYIHYQYTFMGKKNMINDAFAASSTHICLSAAAEVSTDEVKTFQLLN